MNEKGNKFVRFEDYSSSSSFSIELQNCTKDAHNHQRKARSSVSAVLESIRRRIESGSGKINKTLRKPSTILPVSDRPSKKLSSRIKILDPQGPILQKWNKIFVLTCFMAVSVDPLFFYIPVIKEETKCLDLDKTLQIIACVLRTFFDLFYIIRIIFQFRTGFIMPSSRVFGRGELVKDPVAIIKRYLASHFIIDILSILPLPQVTLLSIIPSLTCSSLETKNLLTYTVLVQFVPRFLRISQLFREVNRTSRIPTETAWPGAAYSLCLSMIASHVVGAFWYWFSVESELRCWRLQLKNSSYSKNSYLSCDSSEDYKPDVFSLLNSSCKFIDPDDIKDSEFNFGIFLEALKSQIVESNTGFRQKFFYCFWWGLRNLSSLGQNLKTSTSVGEIIFAIAIAIVGLFLFSLLIGNIQQSLTARVEEMRVKRQDVEQWMSHRMLPESLRERIRRHQHYKWQENGGVEEETLIRNLPKDLRRDIKHHLCLALLKKVPMFEKMDEKLFDAFCDRLKPVLYTEKSYIIREGDPVDEMLFIMRGNLATTTTNGGRTGFFNSFELKAGDFCGEELLTWALDPNSSSHLPISTRTVETISEVEAFALMTDDLKFVASQFRRLHSKQLQHTFRFYSLQWRTWAACFIQAAWRCYCKRKIERSLREEEDKLQDALANEDLGSSPSFGATIYASRFASNALRNLRQKTERKSRMPQRLPPLLPQKPTEPDFTTQLH